MWLILIGLSPTSHPSICIALYGKGQDIRDSSKSPPNCLSALSRRSAGCDRVGPPRVLGNAPLAIPS